MDKGSYIDKLRLSASFRGAIFAVKNVRIKSAAGNGPDVIVTLFDKTGDRKAKKWQASDAERRAFQTSKLVRVSGSIDDKAGYEGELTLTSVEPIEENSLPESEFRAPADPRIASFIADFKELRGKIHDPYLRALLNQVFDPATGKSFCKAVAAAKMHHAYPGGLLEHSVEVARLCASVCAVVKFLNRDLLVSCALLHDVGKIEEMEQGLRAGEYTAQGNLLGHVFLGTLRIAQAADAIEGFPEALKHQVLHLVASHHGALEFGAAKEPAFAEAFVLSQCDLMSARVFECREAKAAAATGQVSAWSESLKRHVYTADVAALAGPIEEIGVEDSVPEFVTKPAGTSLPIRASIPLLGRVAAGAPEKSAEEIDELCEVELPPGGADYLLRVRGESMIGEGIRDGDLLFVRAQQTAGDGDVVVANLPGVGQTVKTLRRDPAGSRARLEASNPDKENPEYAPIPLTDDAQIQGKVVGVLRNL